MAALFTPLAVFAQDTASEAVYTDYSGMFSILNTYSFVSVLLVGAITSIVVLRNARKMTGGIFGDALGYFGIGMLVMLGGITISLGVAFFSEEAIGVLGNVFYITGYVLMAIAADKIRKIVEGK